MGGYPSQPTPDQVQALLQAPNTPGGTGGPVGPPMPPTPISPFRAALAQFNNPQANPQGSNIWDRLMANVGQGKMPTMPGTTIGAPAGAPAAMAAPQPPPMLPQTQMPRPPGIPGLAQTVAGPGGNNALLAQYMALQQLMRGA